MLPMDPHTRAPLCTKNFTVYEGTRCAGMQVKQIADTEPQITNRTTLTLSHYMVHFHCTACQYPSIVIDYYSRNVGAHISFHIPPFTYLIYLSTLGSTAEVRPLFANSCGVLPSAIAAFTCNFSSSSISISLLI